MFNLKLTLHFKLNYTSSVLINSSNGSFFKQQENFSYENMMNIDQGIEIDHNQIENKPNLFLESGEKISHGISESLHAGSEFFEKGAEVTRDITKGVSRGVIAATNQTGGYILDGAYSLFGGTVQVAYDFTNGILDTISDSWQVLQEKALDATDYVQRMAQEGDKAARESLERTRRRIKIVQHETEEGLEVVKERFNELEEGLERKVGQAKEAVREGIEKTRTTAENVVDAVQLGLNVARVSVEGELGDETRGANV